jgi:hypothetical protein
MPVILATWEAEIERPAKWTGGVAQAVKSTCFESVKPSSNPSPNKKDMAGHGGL